MAAKQTAKVMRVTPTMAAKWLENNKCNRPIRETHVRFLQGIMEAGEWDLNGHTIKRNSDGGLVDGQHRLWACVNSGKSFETWVISHVPKKFYKSMDQGSVRTLGDALHGEGVKHYSNLASAIKYYWFINECGAFVKAGRVPVATGMEIYAQNPKLLESVRFMGHHVLWRVAPTGMCAAIHYLAKKKRKHGSKPDKFFQQLADGVRLGKTMPCYLLRQELLEVRIQNLAWHRETLCRKVLLAWNATADGRRLASLDLSPEDKKLVVR